MEQANVHTCLEGTHIKIIPRIYKDTNSCPKERERKREFGKPFEEKREGSANFHQLFATPGMPYGTPISFVKLSIFRQFSLRF